MTGDEGHRNAAKGRIGERVVQNLAEDARIAANLVQVDTTGWDIFLELPPEGRRAHALDLEPGGIACLMQVKSTETQGELSVPIALAHWQRFVRYPLPVFIALVVLTNTTPRAVYLAHVDESWTRRVLKRLRRAAPDAALNKMTLDVTWTELDRLAEATGACMRERITQTVGDPRAYMLQKHEWLEHVGYEGGRCRGAVTFADVDDNELARFAVGLVPSLPVQRIRIDDMRFGVARLIEDRSAEDGLITLSLPELPSVGKTILTVSDPNDIECAEFVFETYVSRVIFPFLPELSGVIRLVSRYVSVVAQLAEDSRFRLSVIWSLGDGVTHELRELAKVGRALRLLAGTGSRTPRIGLRVEGDERDDREAVKADAPPDESALAFYGTMERAWAVLNAFGGDADVSVDPDELFARRKAIEIVDAAFTKAAVSWNFSALALAGTGSEAPRAAGVFPASVAIGAHVYAIVVAMIGDATWSPGPQPPSRWIDVRGSECRMLGLWTVPRPRWSDFDLDAHLGSYTDALASEGLEVLRLDRLLAGPGGRQAQAQESP